MKRLDLSLRRSNWLPTMKYYYTLGDGQAHGPESIDDLRTRQAAGQISGDTLVLPEGTENWVAFKTVNSQSEAPPPPNLSPIQQGSPKALTSPPSVKENAIEAEEETAVVRSVPWIPVLASILCLVVGWLGGYFHRGYSIKKQFENAPKMIGEAMAEAWEDAEAEQLEDAYKEHLKAQPYLEKINFSEIEHKTYEDRFVNKERIVATITNGTDQVLEAVECHLVIENPDRSLPYIDEEVTFYFRDGIEPGETLRTDGGLDLREPQEGFPISLKPIRLLGRDLEEICEGMTDKELAEYEETKKGK